jgi:hypothetical protein
MIPILSLTSKLLSTIWYYPFQTHYWSLPFRICKNLPTFRTNISPPADLLAACTMRVFSWLHFNPENGGDVFCHIIRRLCNFHSHRHEGLESQYTSHCQILATFREQQRRACWVRGSRNRDCEISPAISTARSPEAANSASLLLTWPTPRAWRWRQCVLPKR